MGAIFGEKPWDPRFPLCYPYVVIEEDGKERTLGLPEAIEELLNTLPLIRGRNDPQAWEGLKKTLELRFGLKDGRSRTLREVGLTLGINASRAARLKFKALRLMRHPSRSKRLREFFVPTREDTARLKEKLRLAEMQIAHQNEILQAAGLRASYFEGMGPEVIAATAQALREAHEDREALQALMEKSPNNRLWNVVKRYGRVRGLSDLKAMMKSGEILQVKYIGPKGEAFFRQVLQTAEQVAVS